MEKSIVWGTQVNADLFDPDFATQLQIDPAVLPSREQCFYYELEVTVSALTAGFSEQIKHFYLPDTILRNCKNEMNRYSEILSAQITSVLKLFRDYGLEISNATISGAPIEPSDAVCIQLLRGKDKEHDKKGRLIVPMTIISIIPDRLWLHNQIIHYCQTEIVDHIKHQVQKEIAEIKHPQQQKMIPFRALIQCLFSIKGMKTNASADTIIETARFDKKPPMLAYGNLKEPTRGSVFPEIPTPAWMIYLEKRDGSWKIETYSKGIDAQSRLVSIWKQSHIRTALALHNLVSIQYSFIAHTENGLVSIAPLEATVYDKIQVVWKKDLSTYGQAYHAEHEKNAITGFQDCLYMNYL